MIPLYACRKEDGSITLQGPRDTADVFCWRHPFIDTHLLARAEARNIRKHIATGASDIFFWERAAQQLAAHTTATVSISGGLETLTHLGIAVSAPAGDYETLLRAWIDSAETYGADVMDRPADAIGTITLACDGAA